MSTTVTNRLQSTYAGIELNGRPHPLSAWFVLSLRLFMGGMILFAGIGKLTDWPFDASGYLVHGVDSVSPVSGLYGWMADATVLTVATIDVINVVIPLTQVLIGLALIAGAFVRLAAFGGALQMLMFYLGGWEGDWLAFFDSTLIYALVFLALGAFAAGRIVGLDQYIERTPVGDQPLVERYPKLRYLLG